MNDRLVWIDCEMTGLDLGADALIEVAALVTDFELNVLGDGVDVIVKPPAEALEQMDDFVRNMHAVLRAARRARRRHDDGARPRSRCSPTSRSTAPTAAARRWPATPSRPTAPSWPATCRRSSRFLHYRIVDVSSIKELSRRWFPRAYFSAPAKRGNHRALADIQESIEELRYYREAVFVPSPGPDCDTAKEHRRRARRLAHRAAGRTRSATAEIAYTDPASTSPDVRHGRQGPTPWWV